MRATGKRWIVAIAVAAVGVTWQFSSLGLIERWVTEYPRVTDVLMDRLPHIEFGWFGEAWFFGLILLFAVFHFRRDWRATPSVLLALGLMYFVRGWILFLFPIGAPLGALPADARLALWGHEAHAYFPAGHIAVLTVLAMFAPHRWLRWTLWLGLGLFGVGTLLSKNHYAADSIVGILLGYAVSVWVQHRWLSDRAAA